MCIRDSASAEPAPGQAGSAAASATPDEEGLDDEEFDDLDDEDEDDDDLDEDDDDLDEDDDEDDVRDDDAGAEWEDYVPIETDPDAEPLSEPIGDVTRPEDSVD